MGNIYTSADVDERVAAALEKARGDLSTAVRDDRPPIVTLCGSRRFPEAFAEVAREQTIAGRMVFAPGVFGDVGDTVTDEQKTDSRLHLDKIRHSDLVVIVNPGGYIDEATAREIQYARSLGIPVRYLVPSNAQEQEEQ
jgi:hypothetical protein